MTDRDTRHPEIDPNGPPLEWFEGDGPEDGGIKYIVLSETFGNLGGGEVGEQFNLWEHIVLNVRIREGEDSRVAIEAAEVPDERGTLKEKALAAEQIIERETGFTPRQLMARRAELGIMFKGKKDAPFPVNLWPQREQ